MPYDPQLVQPMRDEVTRLGVKELLTAKDVDAFFAKREGTALLFVNSVCGCAAGGARPALRIALQNDALPDRVATVFAGQDTDATARARSYFPDYPPSSPSIALFKEGQVVHFVPRHMIEGRDPASIAYDLVQAFDRHCAGARAKR
jgi:putative YphP/YqiW family bacilliredoxin